MDDETQIEEPIEEEVEEVIEELETEEVAEETELDKERAARIKAEELADNQRIRAEKAEKEAKRSVKQTPDLTSKDTIAIINAKVHEDDVDEVVELAKFKKVSVADALKLPLVKSILAERTEQRETAEATTTGATRSGSARVSGDSLLSRAQKTGEIPESTADLDAMLEARYAK